MKYFKYLDFSSDSIGFLYQGRDNLPLTIGGILNLLLIILGIGLSSIYAGDVFNKTNPKLLNTMIADFENRKINMSDKRVTVVLQPYENLIGQQNFNFNFSLFTITATSAYYEDKENGIKSKTKKKLKVRPCIESDFHESQKDFFYLNNFAKTGFCLADRDFEVYGQFNSPKFSFLNFRVEECDGFDLRTGKGVKCLNSTERNAQISRYAVSVLITYSTPKILDYEDPLSQQVFNPAYNLSPNTVSKDNYYFSSNVLYQDDDLFLPQADKNLKPIEFTSYSDLQPTVTTKDAFGSEVYLSFYFRVDPFFTYLKRSYKKFPDIFARIFPCINIGYFLINVITSFLRKRFLNSKILNDIFHSRDENELLLIKNMKKELIEKEPSLYCGGCIKTNFNNSNNSNNNFNFPTHTNKDKEIMMHNISGDLLNASSPKLTAKLNDTTNICNKYHNVRKLKLFFQFKQKKIVKQLSDRLMDKFEVKCYLDLHSRFEKLVSVTIGEDVKNVFHLWGDNYLVDDDYNVKSDWLEEFAHTPSLNEVQRSFQTILSKNKNEQEMRLMSHFGNYLGHFE